MKNSPHWHKRLTATVIAALLALAPVIACAMLRLPAPASQEKTTSVLTFQGSVHQIPGSNEFWVRRDCL